MFMFIKVDALLNKRTDLDIMLTHFQINATYFCVNRQYLFMLVIYSPIGFETL